MFLRINPMRINLSARTRAMRSVARAREGEDKHQTIAEEAWYRRVVDVVVYAHVLRRGRQDSERVLNHSYAS
jgi:hypothetical protein